MRVSTCLICLGNFLLTKVNKPLLATLGPLTPDFRRYFKVFQGTLEVRGVWYNLGHSEQKYRKYNSTKVYLYTLSAPKPIFVCEILFFTFSFVYFLKKIFLGPILIIKFKERF